MEIVKYAKVIVPRLSSTKVLRNKLWHNDRASAFEGLALQALPQTSHAWEPRQDMSSSLVVGSGAPAENGFSVI